MPIALIVATAWWTTAACAEQVTLAQVLERLSRNPTISQVQQAAVRHGELGPDRARSLLSRSRCAALLPRLEVSLDRGVERDEDLDREYLEMDQLSMTTDDDLELQIAARWDLDRIVFDPEELRVRRHLFEQGQRRNELLLTVTRLYYELLLLRARAQLSPTGDGGAEESLERDLRIAELRAILDGLTGGLYSVPSS